MGQFSKKQKKTSVFDFKILQRVIFCIEKSQHINFEIKIFRHIGFQKCLHTKNHVLLFFSMKTTYSAIFVLPFKKMVLIWKFTTCQFLNGKEYNASDSEKMLVRFCVKSFTTRQIWNWRKTKRVRLWLQKKQRVRF